MTSPACTLIDIACRLSERRLEAAVNEADKLDLIDLDELRTTLDDVRRPGVARLRKLLDRPTFVLTDSELERLFVPIAARAGLPKPKTQLTLHGHRVDFYFDEIGLVVETDGLRYPHPYPAEEGPGA